VASPEERSRRNKPVSDIFDERRRGLEEEYFRRRDKESLERLREAIREEAQKRGDQPVTMDRCDTCGGVWLDAGELEQIIGEESGSGRWFRALWPGRSNQG
jgi:hypothetical protein